MFKTISKFAITACVIAAGYFGFKMYNGAGNAVINGMTTSGMDAAARCWVDFEFKRIPEGVNPTDIKMVFTGGIIEGGTIEYGWGFIGENAQVPKKAGKGWEKASGVTPAGPPPLNYEFSVNFPIPAKASMMSDADFDMTGTLFWGGKKQSFRVTSFRYQYKAQM